MSDYLIKRFYIYYFVSLFIIIILRKIFGSNNFFNKVVNLYVYIFEFFSFGVLFNLLIDREGFQSNKSIMLIVKDFVFSNTIYQILINMILKFWDGATIDAYNSMIVYIKRCLVLSNNKESIELFLEESEKGFTFLNKIGTYDKDTKDVKKSIDEINNSFLVGSITHDDYKNMMELELIRMQNLLSIITFGWQSSMLLRFLR